MTAIEIETLIRRSVRSSGGWCPWLDDNYRDWRWMIPVLARLAAQGPDPMASAAFAAAIDVVRTFTSASIARDFDLVREIGLRAAQILLDAGVVRVDPTGAVRGAVHWRMRRGSPATLSAAELVALPGHLRRS